LYQNRQEQDQQSLKVLSARPAVIELGTVWWELEHKGNEQLVAMDSWFAAELAEAIVFDKKNTPKQRPDLFYYKGSFVLQEKVGDLNHRIIEF